MPNEVPISLLKPHPKNKEFFPDSLPDHLWQELVEDVRENGIINPLVVTPDYTVLAGHLRLEAAKEAGLTHVPVVIRDVDSDSDEAVSLLIRDNLLRRQLSDVQVAKLIRRLKEIYAVNQGRPKARNGYSGREKQDKMSELLGIDERHIRRLDKLNDLIPDLQALVESGKWNTTTVASIVGSLPPEEQEELFASLGESGICGLSVKEAQGLKKELDSIRKEKNALQEQLVELKDEKEALSRQLASLQDTLSSAEKEIAEKLGRQYDEKLNSAIAGLQAKLRDKEREIDRLAAELKEKQIEKVVEKVIYRPDPKTLAELDDLRGRLKAREEQIAALKKQYAQVKEELDKTHESLNNYLRANAELKGHGIAQETRFRTSLTTAAKVIGEALSRIKAEFRPGFKRNADLVKRIDFLASHLEQAAGELRSLLKEIDIGGGPVGQVIDVNSTGT
ncbi:MAG: ParB N-terminal domain-containing protein [Bacillota bacterium]